MPPVAPFIIPALFGGAAMVDQNMQKKSTIKNKENAEASAKAGVTNAQGVATGNLNDYLKANPGPAQASNQPGAAAYSGSSIPLAGAQPGTSSDPRNALNTMAGAAPPTPGMMSGAPGGAGKSLPPAVLAMLKQAMSGSG